MNIHLKSSDPIHYTDATEEEAKLKKMNERKRSNPFKEQLKANQKNAKVQKEQAHFQFDKDIAKNGPKKDTMSEHRWPRDKAQQHKAKKKTKSAPPSNISEYINQRTSQTGITTAASADRTRPRPESLQNTPNPEERKGAKSRLTGPNIISPIPNLTSNY